MGGLRDGAGVAPILEDMRSFNFGEQVKAVKSCFGDWSGVGSAVVLLRISYILLKLRVVLEGCLNHVLRIR